MDNNYILYGLILAFIILIAYLLRRIYFQSVKPMLSSKETKFFSDEDKKNTSWGVLAIIVIFFIAYFLMALGSIG